jgi:hypothetical protein
VPSFEGAAARVNRFLGGWLDEAAMAAAIAPDLHRQRTQPPTEPGQEAQQPLRVADRSLVVS